MKKYRRKGRVRNNIEEREEKREEDKIGKETRALQVPAGQKHVGTVRKTTDRMQYRRKGGEKGRG